MIPVIGVMKEDQVAGIGAPGTEESSTRRGPPPYGGDPVVARTRRAGEGDSDAGVHPEDEPAAVVREALSRPPDGGLSEQASGGGNDPPSGLDAGRRVALDRRLLNGLGQGDSWARGGAGGAHENA